MKPHVRANPWLMLALLVAPGCGVDPLDHYGPEIVDAELVVPEPVTESVRLDITLWNPTQRDIIFQRGELVSRDLEVRNDRGEVVWRYLAGVFSGVAVEYVLAAGDSVTWSVTWTLVDQNGARVPPGTYMLRGAVGEAPRIPLRYTRDFEVAVP